MVEERVKWRLKQNDSRFNEGCSAISTSMPTSMPDLTLMKIKLEIFMQEKVVKL